MKPFNLQSALAGEPVILNNGYKAKVLSVIRSKYGKDDRLLGYYSYKDANHREVDNAMT